MSVARPMRPRRAAAATAVCLTLLLPACKEAETPTSATSTTTTAAAAAVVTEIFEGTLPKGGAQVYAFDNSGRGNISVKLDSIGGVAGVPRTVWVGVGIGTPDGDGCAMTVSKNTQAGGDALVLTMDPGRVCVRLYDIGNLAAPAPFSATVIRP